MLLGQNCGGHQNGTLLAVHDAFHGRPQGHLGFSEAHIAAEQPIHGGGGLHIRLDFVNAAELVIGFCIGKAVLKLGLPGAIRRKGIAGQALSLGIELNQHVRQILRGCFGLFLGLFPGVAPQTAQAHVGILAAADVFCHHVQLGGGDIEHIGALIGNFDIVLHHAAELHLLHAAEPANTMGLVYHQVAGRKIRKGIELLTIGGGFFLLSAEALAGRGGDLSLGENGDF